MTPSDVCECMLAMWTWVKRQEKKQKSFTVWLSPTDSRSTLDLLLLSLIRKPLTESPGTQVIAKASQEILKRKDRLLAERRREDREREREGMLRRKVGGETWASGHSTHAVLTASRLFLSFSLFSPLYASLSMHERRQLIKNRINLSTEYCVVVFSLLLSSSLFYKPATHTQPVEKGNTQQCVVKCADRSPSRDQVLYTCKRLWDRVDVCEEKERSTHFFSSCSESGFFTATHLLNPYTCLLLLHPLLKTSHQWRHLIEFWTEQKKTKLTSWQWTTTTTTTWKPILPKRSLRIKKATTKCVPWLPLRYVNCFVYVRNHHKLLMTENQELWISLTLLNNDLSSCCLIYHPEDWHRINWRDDTSFHLLSILKTLTSTLCTGWSLNTRSHLKRHNQPSCHKTKSMWSFTDWNNCSSVMPFLESHWISVSGSGIKMNESVKHS